MRRQDNSVNLENRIINAVERRVQANETRFIFSHVNHVLEIIYINIFFHFFVSTIFFLFLCHCFSFELIYINITKPKNMYRLCNKKNLIKPSFFFHKFHVCPLLFFNISWPFCLLHFFFFFFAIYSSPLHIINFFILLLLLIHISTSSCLRFLHFLFHNFFLLLYLSSSFVLYSTEDINNISIESKRSCTTI